MDIEIISIESEAEETVVKIEKVDSEDDAPGEAAAKAKSKPKIFMKIRDMVKNSSLKKRLKPSGFNFKFKQVKVKTPKKRNRPEEEHSNKRPRIEEVQTPVLRRPKAKVSRKPRRTTTTNAPSTSRNLFPDGFTPGQPSIINPIANDRDGRILSVIRRNPQFNDSTRAELNYSISNPIFNFDP